MSTVTPGASQCVRGGHTRGSQTVQAETLVWDFSPFTLPEPSRAPVGPPALIYVHSESSHSSRENLRPEISALTPSTHSVTSTVHPGTRDVSICGPPSLQTHLSWLKAPATPEAGPPASYVRLSMCGPQSLESQARLFFPALSSERQKGVSSGSHP